YELHRPGRERMGHADLHPVGVQDQRMLVVQPAPAGQHLLDAEPEAPGGLGGRRRGAPPATIPAHNPRETRQMAHQPTADAVVGGGGVIGLGIAWRAASAGMAVTVVDQAPGKGASWAAAGMLAPVTEVHYGEAQLLALNLAAAGRWPSFAAEVEEASGRPVGYRPRGAPGGARGADDTAAPHDPYPAPRP